MTTLAIATLPESEIGEGGGRVILTGDRLERVRATHFPTTAIVQSYMMGHVGPITAVEELQVGSGRVISASMDGMLGVWDVRTGKCLVWVCVDDLCSSQFEEVKALTTVNDAVTPTDISTSNSERKTENAKEETPSFVVAIAVDTRKCDTKEGVILACVIKGFGGAVVVLKVHPSTNTIEFMGKVPLEGEASDVAFLGDALLVISSPSGPTSCDSVFSFSMENFDKGEKDRKVSAALPNSQAGKVAKLLLGEVRRIGMTVQHVNEEEIGITGLQRKNISEARKVTGWNTYSL